MKNLFAASVCVLLLGGCMSASSVSKKGYDFAQLSKVAVVSVEGNRLNVAAQNEIADLFEQQLLASGYDVIERTQIQKVLSEQSFQRSGETPDDDAVKAGKILNVTAVMVVNVPAAHHRVRMTAKLIEVETGMLLWSAEGNGSTKEGALTIAGIAVGIAAGAVLGHQVGPHSGGSVLGGIAGGTAGYAAGHYLEPEAATMLRKLIGLMCKKLPYSGAPSQPFQEAPQGPPDMEVHPDR